MDRPTARALGPQARVATLLLLTACGSGVEPQDPEANVIVFVAAEFATTEEAVFVNGAPRIHFNTQDRGYFTQHSVRYENGGPFAPASDQRLDEAWYMDVGRRVVTGEHGDTTFSHYVDLGAVSLGGTAANKITIDTVRTTEVGEGDVRVYDNFILNRITFQLIRYKTDGSLVTFAHEPAYESVVAGNSVTLAATGSSEAAPFSADIQLRPSARIASIWNGSDVTFQTAQPVIESGRPLVIDFTRELEPAETIIHMVYLEPPPQDFELQRRASAVFELTGRSGRVVIPPSALRAMKEEVVGDEVPFLLRVYEHLYREDVVELEHLPGGPTESLGGAQTNVIDLYLRMR